MFVFVENDKLSIFIIFLLNLKEMFCGCVLGVLAMETTHMTMVRHNFSNKLYKI